MNHLCDSSANQIQTQTTIELVTIEEMYTHSNEFALFDIYLIFYVKL